MNFIKKVLICEASRKVQLFHKAKAVEQILFIRKRSIFLCTILQLLFFL